MIKKVFPILLLYIIFSCTTAKVKKGDILYRNLDNIDYTEILYSFKNNKEFNSKTGLNFTKNNNHVLDSIFLEDSEKFKIRNKVHLPKDLTLELIKDLVSELDKSFNSTKLEKFPVDISSVLKSDTKFLLIPFIKPCLELKESYSNRNTVLITNPYYTVKSFELKIFIIDVSQNTISFYGSKEAIRDKSLGYGHNMLRSLNEIFKEFNN